MIDAARLRWMFWRLVRGRGREDDFLRQADRVREIAPGERFSGRPALYLEGDLDKVRSFEAWRNWDMEWRFISGAAIDHRPTWAYEFSDVAMSGPFVFHKRTRGHYGAGDQGSFLRDRSEWQDLKAAHLVTCRNGSEYFGHFMWDNLPMELLPGAEEMGITLCGQSRWHEEDYRRLYDLPKPKLVRFGRVGRLTVYNDTGQNSHRAARYRKLRARVRQALINKRNLPPSVGVFVQRGTTGADRELVNEAEIIGELRGLGFDIINPDTMGGEEIAQRTLDAKVVVGVDGSHVAHTLYTIADDGAFLILQPPDRFSMVYKEFTDSLDMTYAFLVGEPTAGGFSIDTGDLKRLLDKL